MPDGALQEENMDQCGSKSGNIAIYSIHKRLFFFSKNELIGKVFIQMWADWGLHWLSTVQQQMNKKKSISFIETWSVSGK